MKKYRLTFDHPVKAQKAWCAAVMDHKCGACPLAKIKPDGRSCGMFALHHLDEAAELMGLEVVEVEDKPRLTELELAICKAVGAKWVSRDENDDTVCLWESKPILFPGAKQRYYTDGVLITRIHFKLFPSLKAGDCVNVEDCRNDAE